MSAPISTRPPSAPQAPAARPDTASGDAPGDIPPPPRAGRRLQVRRRQRQQLPVRVRLLRELALSSALEVLAQRLCGEGRLIPAPDGSSIRVEGSFRTHWMAGSSPASSKRSTGGPGDGDSGGGGAQWGRSGGGGKAGNCRTTGTGRPARSELCLHPADAGRPCVPRASEFTKIDARAVDCSGRGGIASAPSAGHRPPPTARGYGSDFGAGVDGSGNSAAQCGPRRSNIEIFALLLISKSS
jgi:hypothetical protein